MCEKSVRYTYTMTYTSFGLFYDTKTMYIEIQTSCWFRSLSSSNTTSPAKERLRQCTATWLLKKEVSLVIVFLYYKVCVSSVEQAIQQCGFSVAGRTYLFQLLLSCEKISQLRPRSLVASAWVVPTAPLSRKILCPCVSSHACVRKVLSLKHHIYIYR